MRYAISANIGGTNSRFALFSQSGLLDTRTIKTPLTGNNDTLPSAAEVLIRGLLTSNNIKLADGVHLGVALAGYKRPDLGNCSFFASNICGRTSSDGSSLNSWDAIDFDTPYFRSFSSLNIKNDVLCETTAEWMWGAMRNINDSLYINWGTGIGIGIISGGRVLSGKNGNASHGGHQVVQFEQGTNTCGCGRKGDVESIAGGRFLIEEWRDNIDSLFLAYKNNDKRAERIIKNATSILMIGVTNLSVSLDTRVICFGGGVFENHRECLLPLVVSEFSLLPAIFKDGVEIKSGSLSSKLTYLAGLAAIPIHAIPWATNLILNFE